MEKGVIAIVASLCVVTTWAFARLSWDYLSGDEE